MTFKRWIKLHKNDCFRYWIHKRMFTPYEIEQKFSDESCLENDECLFGYIVEYIILPDGDVLLGMSEDKIGDYISYYKLSNLDLALRDKEDDEE